MTPLEKIQHFTQNTSIIGLNKPESYIDTLMGLIYIEQGNKTFTIHDSRETISHVISTVYPHIQKNEIAIQKLANAIAFLQEYTRKRWNMNLQINEDAAYLYANVEKKELDAPSEWNSIDIPTFTPNGTLLDFPLKWFNTYSHWDIYLNAGVYKGEVQTNIIKTLELNPMLMHAFAAYSHTRKTITQFEPLRVQNDAEKELANALKRSSIWKRWVLENVDSHIWKITVGKTHGDLKNILEQITSDQAWSKSKIDDICNIYEMHKALGIPNAWAQALIQIEQKESTHARNLDI